MPDKYDEEIAYLTEYPGEIKIHWSEYEPLFAIVAPKGEGLRRLPCGECCGCLTQIRSRQCVAWTEVLTKAIRADDRIPDDPDDITPAHLPIFAEWQRRIDRELGRDASGKGEA